MKFLFVLSFLFIFCYPQRERTVYYIFTFENQAGYKHQATITKSLFDKEFVFDTTTGGINIQPKGYDKWIGLQVIYRGDTVYEY